jgi:hypothetical protein
MKKHNEMNIYELKNDLSLEAHLGYPVFIAGILFWLFVGICSFFLPQETLVWLYLFGIGAILPLAILISKILKINFLAAHNPLSTVGGLVGGMQIFFAPIVIMVAYHQPEWMPFVIGVLTGAHFLPYVWIYDTKIYLFQTMTTVIVSSVIGIGFMDQSFHLTPFALSVVYIITAILLIRKHRTIVRDKEEVANASVIVQKEFTNQ